MSAPLPLFGDRWPFGNLKQQHYGVILSDHPWRFMNRSAAGEAKNPVAHYPCMTLASMRAMPVQLLAADNCALVMWAVAPLLPEALALMEFYGFTYKTAGAWGKQSSTGAKLAFGPGYILRSAAEFYLIGTRGEPRIRSHSIRNLIMAPIREHSRKPDQLHSDIEKLFRGPYVELFARQRRSGWDCWGNETDRFAAVG